MFTATLFVGILFILLGLGFFAYAAYLHCERQQELEAAGEVVPAGAKSTAPAGIFNIVAFGAITLGSLLFCLGYFNQVYAERVSADNTLAPATLDVDRSND